MKATISGDIVSSTALSTEGRVALEKLLKKLVRLLDQHFGVFARVIKGDYLECYLPQPELALRIALLIKCYIKSASIDSDAPKKELSLFRTHGIRLAIGVGEITRFDAQKGIIDGEAIYLSGRLINQQSGTHGQRPVIKSTLFIGASQQAVVDEFDPVLALLDVLISQSTARQCEIIYLKLLNFNEDEIAHQLKITQATVNQHSRSAGWNAIDKAVTRFSIAIKNIEQ
jgi:hypothetical protein